MDKINIIGKESFDEFTINKIEEVLGDIKEKYNRIFNINSLKDFKVVIQAKPKSGEEHLFEVIVNIDTQYGLFRSEKQGYKILDIIDQIKNDLERQIIEKKERVKAKRKYPDNA
ncbi:MAG: hypothetical protein J7J93_00585 [Candidatus Aenigmarchaeota archaeon]|nr:hypothetical protein [Candidatus Aenigmarchaeota archaeon]